MISENCFDFNVLKSKSLQAVIAIVTQDKVTEIFCIADDICEVLFYTRTVIYFEMLAEFDRFLIST